METLDTLVDWATEEESGRWTDETLTSVLELVSGMNTLTRTGARTQWRYQETFIMTKAAIFGLVAFSMSLFFPHICTQNHSFFIKKKLTTSPSELCPTWQSDSGACA